MTDQSQRVEVVEADTTVKWDAAEELCDYASGIIGTN